MGFTCGIVGLPNVGKSTLFNAITAANAQVANYPFCTIDPNVGIVPVPDPRLERVAAVFGSPKCVHTTLEFLDIAGLVKGASKGEGLGNQFLSHIRNVNAVAHVVRCFDDSNIIHVNGKVDPGYDIEIVETELILKDIETVEKKIAETNKRAKSGDKKAINEEVLYVKLKDHLLKGKPVRGFTPGHEDEKSWLNDLQLLTSKIVMYVCNVHEKDLDGENEYVGQVREIASKENAGVVIVSAEVEAEIARLSENERPEFLSGLGLKESGLTRVIKKGYDILNLATFFTANDKEAHAWTIRKGATAIQAAGSIHTDFEKGFIRAEIVKFQDMDRLGSESAVKEAGLLHVQGRDYIIEDGDVVFVRFNL